MASHQGDLADLDQLSVEVVALLPPGDRAAVTAAVETVRDRWLRLESRVAEEGAELEEASEVGRQFEEAQGKLADWAGKCERIGEEKGTGVGSGDAARGKLARTEVRGKITRTSGDPLNSDGVRFSYLSVVSSYRSF